MAVQTQLQLLTADDLWELSHRGQDVPEPRRLELVQGMIYEMSPTGGLHGIITGELAYRLVQFVKTQRLGYVTGAETGFVLATDPATVRAPDAAYIRQDRMPRPIPERYLPLAPDLAVEVVSPSDSAQDIRARVMDFLNAGTQAVWVVYPNAQTVDVYRPGRDTQVVGPADTLEGGEVLPGFSLPLRDLFASLQPG